MALLKQIKFGTGEATPIAQTQVAINENSSNVLSVQSTNTELDVEQNPLYTIALAVDGKTIAKGANGLETSLALKVEAASGEGQDAKKARIALVDSNGGSGYAELSSVNIEDIVGSGIISGTAYDPSTGKLTITWAGSTEQSPKTTVIDLAELLDFEDITIKNDSTEYLSFEKVSPAPGTDEGQAQLGVKVADVTFTAASGENPANLTVDTTNGKILDASDAIPAIKDYVDDVVENASTDLAVKAQGDAYVAASVDANDNKKVVVATNKQDLTATAGTPGVYDADGSQTTAPTAGTLSGTANSLADGADIAAKVKTYVDGAIAIEAARSDAKNKADIAALDFTDTEADGQYVSKVDETNGKISVKRKDVSGAKLNNYTKGTAELPLAATDTINQAFSKIEVSIEANENVTSTALNSINAKIKDMAKAADAADGQVVTTVSEADGVVNETKANVKDLQLGGYEKTSATGDIAGTDTINTALSKLENAIDAATTKVEKDANASHLTLANSTAADGSVTYTIGESDIASKTALDAEIAARKAVDGQSGDTYAKNTNANYIKEANSLNDADVKLDTALKAEETRAQNAETAIDGAVGLTKAASGEGRTYANNGEYIGKGQTNTVTSDIKALDTKLKEVADGLAAVQYEVSGTTLVFYGISEKTNA